MMQSSSDATPGRATGLAQGPRPRPRRLLRGRAARWVVSVGVVCFLIPHTYVVATGTEAYPLTCAAMFAHQVTPQTPRYVFHLTGDDGPGGTERLIDRKEANASGRKFFTHAYGSASPNNSHHHYPDDTPDAFAQRMSDYFVGFHHTWLRMNPDKQPPGHITLWLMQIYPEQGEPDAVLRFNASDRRIELQPDVDWPEGVGLESEQGGDEE